MELRSWGQISMQIVDNYGQDLSTRFFSFISLHLTSSTSDIILMNTIFAVSLFAMIMVTKKHNNEKSSQVYWYIIICIPAVSCTDNGNNVAVLQTTF